MSNSALQIGRPHRSLCSKGILRPTASSYVLQTLYDPLYSNFKLTCDVQYTLTELDRVKPAKVTLAQLGKQLSAFSTETMIITMFTSTPYANAPCPQLQESSPKTLFINDALILSFHLCPHLPTELLPTSFPTWIIPAPSFILFARPNNISKLLVMKYFIACILVLYIFPLLSPP